MSKKEMFKNKRGSKDQEVTKVRQQKAKDGKVTNGEYGQNNEKRQ